MDALYILGTGSKWGNSELRFSLRSLEKFCQVDQVFVVGENPKFLTDKVVFRHVRDAAGNKEYRIAAKIAWACKNTDISPEFLFLNDDHILLQQIDPPTYPYYFKCDLMSMPLSNAHASGYQKALKDTRDALKEAGASTLHFDVHMPIRYRKEDFLKLEPWWQKSKRSRNGFVVKSIYCNTVAVSPKQQISDCKITRPKTPADVAARVSGRHVFSFGDQGIARGVGTFLAANFPDKSKYET